jgi:hypothetical protein
MFDSINAQLKQAESLCDADGFIAFKRRYCSKLERGRSWAYERLAIEEGRKSLDQVREATRLRVAKHRAAKEQKANVTDSESVTSPPQSLEEALAAYVHPVGTILNSREIRHSEQAKYAKPPLDELPPIPLALVVQEDGSVANVEEPETPSTPTVSCLNEPWKAVEAEAGETTLDDEHAALENYEYTKAPLGDLEKQLQDIVDQIGRSERAAANLISHMVDQRKQNVRSIAKLIGKDPKWVKEKLDFGRPVAAEAAA